MKVFKKKTDVVLAVWRLFPHLNGYGFSWLLANRHVRQLRNGWIVLTASIRKIPTPSRN